VLCLPRRSERELRRRLGVTRLTEQLAEDAADMVLEIVFHGPGLSLFGRRESLGASELRPSGAVRYRREAAA
jgi:hypothetical protein